MIKHEERFPDSPRGRDGIPAVRERILAALAARRVPACARVSPIAAWRLKKGLCYAYFTVAARRPRSWEVYVHP